MATPKKTEAPSPGHSGRQVVEMPPVWLAAIMALLVVPWLIAAVIYTGLPGTSEGRPPAAGASAPTANRPTTTSASGPWGTLAVTPIVVSPPLEFITANWGRNAPPEWYLTGDSIAAVEGALIGAGLTREQVSQLLRTGRPDPGTGSVIVRPDLQLVRGLSTDVRTRLYFHLARHTPNFDQTNAFRFQGASPDNWFGGSMIAPGTRRLIEPFIYRRGQFMYFADIEVIRAEVGGPEELQRLAKTLLRSSTVLVRLSIGQTSEVTGLAEYWGRGGRRTDIRPLLESVAEGGPAQSIDIVHLLPAFARDHLYRYPRITAADLNRPLLANCLWTVLNFFNAVPDNRYLDVRTAIESLRREFYIVEHGYELGDVVAFLDAEGDLFHAAVYIADDLVFSKNGSSPMAPWTLMSLADLKAYYQSVSDEIRVVYHRRNGF